MQPAAVIAASPRPSPNSNNQRRPTGEAMSSSGSPSIVFKNANGSVSKPVQSDERVSPLVIRNSSSSVGGCSTGNGSSTGASNGVKMSVITSGIRESISNNGNKYQQLQNYPYFSYLSYISLLRRIRLRVHLFIITT